MISLIERNNRIMALLISLLISYTPWFISFHYVNTYVFESLRGHLPTVFLYIAIYSLCAGVVLSNLFHRIFMWLSDWYEIRRKYHLYMLTYEIESYTLDRHTRLNANQELNNLLKTTTLKTLG
jgi:hypothetical protein